MNKEKLKIALDMFDYMQSRINAIHGMTWEWPTSEKTKQSLWYIDEKFSHMAWIIDQNFDSFGDFKDHVLESLSSCDDESYEFTW